MNDQTQRAFALGGEAETVDPVSGNDVPPGSLPEEVRDDIDAKLSEGEYVVPADVVSGIGNGSSDAGSNKLEDMMDRVRQLRTGGTTQPPAVPDEMMLPA